MERLQNSQLPKILLLASFLALLLSTPFIPTSTRSSYLYFLLNLLIIVLGVEAGFISKPREEKKTVLTASAAEAVTGRSTNATAAGSDTTLGTTRPAPKNHGTNAAAAGSGTTSATTKPAQKPVVSEVKKERVRSLKRCKSRPSLFFIGGCGVDDDEEEVEKEEDVAVKRRVVEEDEEMSKQELFMKAEMFIGDFYKQLKMQKEKSWQKLNGLYQKAF